MSRELEMGLRTPRAVVPRLQHTPQRTAAFVCRPCSELKPEMTLIEIAKCDLAYHL